MATPITIAGVGFYGSLIVDLDDDSPPAFDDGWSVRVGETVFDAATVDRVDATRLELVIPAGMSPGVYSVIAQSPAGETATLADALEIIDPSIECMTDADCADRCRSGNRCDGDVCVQGPVDLDADGDGAIDDTCPGGDDCDDDPATCGAACFPGNTSPDIVDGFDQDCDGMTDEDPDSNPPTITLLGPNPVFVAANSAYVDAGATAFDAEAGDLTASIVVANPVDTTTRGTYTVTYDVMDPSGNPAMQVTRTVHVTYDCANATIASRPLEQNTQSFGGVAYFVVCSFGQLEEVGGDAADTSLTANYLLGTDIDAVATANPGYNLGAGWAPIGGCTGTCGGGDDSPFTGIFNGGHHAISNLFVNRPTEDGVGLFGIAQGADILDIDVDDCDVTGDGYVGGLAGYVLGGSAVRRSSANGRVSGVSRVGGLIGVIGASTIEDVYVKTDVSANNRAGGLIGNVINSTTNRAYVSGSVTATSRVGGLIGNSSGAGTIVNDSFVAIEVTGNSNTDGDVGAVLGASFGFTESNLYFDSTKSVVNMGSGALRTGIGTPIDVGGAAPADYFFTPANPPLSSWDFDAVWTALPSAYPILQ